MLRDRRGYSVSLWTAFFTFLMLPILSMAIGIGRYAVAAAEVQEGADLAALAAARDILVRLYENEGYVQFADQVPYWRAEHYANLNTYYLAQHGIHVDVESITIDEAHDTITVRVSANLDPLFPQVFPDIIVVREGEAQVRMRAWMP